MNRNTRVFCCLVLGLAALSGCSSKPSAKDSTKAGTALDKIQGKAQVLIESGGAMDSALNAGGPSVYIWEGMRRYRLFFKTPVEIIHGDEYAVEGVCAQRIIDDIGDPDQGKNGYPLRSSCERVVRTVWSGQPLDAISLHAEVLRARVQRYPARPVFLVSRIRSVKPTDSSKTSAEQKKIEPAKDKSIAEVTVPADKQRALLVEGSPVQTAPLWEPAGGTVRCSVVIDPEGRVSDLETGAQLCETVAWSQFRYQPTVRSGRPVKVRTDVEVRFEPRK